MKILIPNATGPTNIGDQAILHGLLSIINKKHPGAEIVIHSSDPELYDDRNHKIKSHLYFWAVFENLNPLTRIFRLIQLVMAYTALKFKISSDKLISPRLSDLVRDYKTADKIIFVGGGYLRSKRGSTQSLNLLMLLTHFLFAKNYREKTIIAPMSFGPFAYNWHEILSAKIIDGFPSIFVREEKSYNLLKKRIENKIILSHDTAILLNNLGTKRERNKFVLGFTIRNWRENYADQIDFEKHFANALIKFNKEYNCDIKPIVQVRGYKDTIEYDVGATKRITKTLEESDTSALKTVFIESVDHAEKILGSIDMLLGMRMHSNIIAATQSTPFVAISYEHKTESISKYLSMSKYCIRQEDVTAEKLFKLLSDLYLNITEATSKMNESIESAKNNLEISLSL